MREHGVEVAITPVGDRHVLAELLRRGWALGGEQSGHIIDMGFVPSGDGIASALLAMEAIAGGDLHERRAMEKLWKKIKQHDIHLHYFPTFEALTEKVEQALLKFANAPEEVRALCGLPTELAQAA